MRTNHLAAAVFAIVAPLLFWDMALPASASEKELSTATLPLEEILRLYRTSEEARKPRKEEPPVRASIDRMELKGRLLGEAVELTVHFKIAVLEDGGWIVVPLLKRGEGTNLSNLPAVPDAYFAMQGGYLNFLSRRRGNYSFSLGLHERATIDGKHRRVDLETGSATLAVCRLAFDSSVFRLESPVDVQEPEDAVIFPQGNVLSIEWTRIGGAEVAMKQPVARPAIEPLVTRVSASSVSTLEGIRITRVLYQLKFDGERAMEVDVPEGQAIEHAYLNGVPIVVGAAKDGKLEIEVSPARAGETTGVFELVLETAAGKFLLSGSVDISLPRISWPINELYLDVHLPEVFNYEWTGGSLGAIDESPKADFTYQLPLPGKKLSFHQELISSKSPNVTLSYTVDLEGHYYRSVAKE